MEQYWTRLGCLVTKWDETVDGRTITHIVLETGDDDESV